MDTKRFPNCTIVHKTTPFLEWTGTEKEKFWVEMPEENCHEKQALNIENT